MKSSDTPLTYRPEIDGLRAIAVLSVLIYHLKITVGTTKLLPGGFLGVDLFFVLSGFLITQILLKEFATTGRISIAEFYVRRSKRILPPLLLVMLCSAPVAWAIMLPGELERFALSLLSTLLFVSNFFWFFELSEYGAQSGLLQPYLHTWSLAIEEQFYFVFPPLLLLLLHRWGQQSAFAVVLVTLVLSLVGAHWLTGTHPAFSFYAPTSRAWELLAGSSLGFLSLRAPSTFRRTLISRIVPPVSLLVLIVCFAVLDLPEITHPGAVTVPVILATCGLIWFASPTEPVTRLLSLTPIVWVGRLSYSLYLWHFPVFAFGRLLSIDEPGATDMFAWVILTFALSIAGYHLVERPFRFRLKTRPFAFAMAAACVPILIGCTLVVTGRISAPGPQGNLTELYGPATIDNEALGLATWKPLDALSLQEDIGPWNALRPSDHEKTDLWFTDDQRRKILIIGDSHAKDVYNSLTLNPDRFPETGFARFNLHRRTLNEDIESMLAAPNFRAADTVMIAPRYYREYRETLATILGVLQSQGKTVIVLGNTAEFDVGGDLPLFDWHLRKAASREALKDLNARAPQFETPGAAQMEQDIKQIAIAAGAAFFSRRALMCGADDCTIVTSDGKKTMYDDTHWTLDGAALFGGRAADAGWLAN